MYSGAKLWNGLSQELKSAARVRIFILKYLNNFFFIDDDLNFGCTLHRLYIAYSLFVA